MSAEVTMLRPVVNNPATRPEITDALRNTVESKRAAAMELLQGIAAEFGTHGEVTFANSMGAEDMVLTDIILRGQLPIEIFSLDTGRLPAETYDLIAAVESTYNTKLKIFFPRSDTVEAYVKSNGINAFYESVDLRKACCHMRKVEPLQRALSGKKAWITGMRAQQSATRTA